MFFYHEEALSAVKNHYKTIKYNKNNPLPPFSRRTAYNYTISIFIMSQTMSEYAPNYEKHIKIRPRPVKGYWQNWRKAAVLILLGIFTFLPFLQWQGRQAILFALAERRFYIFNLTIWPQDFILLTFILLGLALLLFFITALLGRVWCGYACPQTVYTEVFLWIEQKIEGNRSEQLKLARAPWNKEKISKRVGKYAAWALVALITGLSFVGYFTPIRALIVDLFTFNAPFTAWFWILFYGGFCYMQAGVVREKFCKFMCPYARFQGAMFDQDTLIIAYDEARGEPRRRLKKQDREDKESLGFCVDCTMCVQVCPTGIDIRNGLQLECIACAACIDACDNMMDQIGAPHGLIRYTSSTALLKGGKTRFARPKTLGYGVILFATLIFFIVTLSTKSTLEFNVLRDRNVLGRYAGDYIQNSFTLKILNKTDRARTFTLAAEGLDGLHIVNAAPFTVAASGIQETIIRVNAPRDVVTGTSNIRLVVIPQDAPDEAVRHDTTFHQPNR